MRYVIATLFIIASTSKLPAYEWTYQDLQDCYLKVFADVYQGRQNLTFYEIDNELIQRLHNECGLPKKNMYIVVCKDEGIFCDKAGDMIPESNFTPDHIKNSVQKSKPAHKKSTHAPKHAPKQKAQPVEKIVKKSTQPSKTITITVPVDLQDQLDNNLEHFLNNTCPFVTQSQAHADANVELAIECARLWAIVGSTK